MSRSTIPQGGHVAAMLLLAATLAQSTPVSPSRLVDVNDYPPYFYAIKKVADRAGLHGVEASPGYSVFDDGVRVMPIKIVISGELEKLDDLLARLRTDFPFLVRNAKLSLEQTKTQAAPKKLGLQRLSSARPHHGTHPVPQLL